MKKAVTPVFAIAVTLFAAMLLNQNFTYVGAQKCRMCHKGEKIGRQYPIWESSKHSKSYAALSTETATSAAQTLGIKDPTTEPKCLKCHGPFSEKAPAVKSEGVGCEICHGPGSEYKKLSLMQNREEAVKNGLKLYGGSADAIKTFCLSCHEKAHGKSFDFAMSWDKIKHPVPGK